MIFNKIGQKAYRVGLLTCGIMSVAGCVKQPTKYDLIVNEINALIPQRPVSVVADYRTGDCRGYYSTSSHQVVIEGGVRANGPDTIVHEMGHAVFRVLTHFDPRTGRSQDELWRKIYAFSLTANNFELVRDIVKIIEYICWILELIFFFRNLKFKFKTNRKLFLK